MDLRPKNNNKNNYGNNINAVNLRSQCSRQLGSKQKSIVNGSKSKSKANRGKTSKHTTSNPTNIITQQQSPLHSRNLAPSPNENDGYNSTMHTTKIVSNSNIDNNGNNDNSTGYFDVIVNILKILITRDQLVAKKQQKISKQANVLQQLLENIQKDAKLRNMVQMHAVKDNRDKEQLLIFIGKQRDKILSMLRIQCAKTKLEALDSQDWREQLIRLYTYVTYQDRQTVTKYQKAGHDLLNGIYQRFDELSSVVNWLFSTMQRMGNQITNSNDTTLDRTYSSNKSNIVNASDNGSNCQSAEIQCKQQRNVRKAPASLTMKQLSCLIQEKLQKKSANSIQRTQLLFEQVKKQQQKEISELKKTNTKLITQLQKIQQQFEYVVEDKLHLQDKLNRQLRVIQQLKQTVKQLSSDNSSNRLTLNTVVSKLKGIKQQTRKLKYSMEKFADGVNIQLSQHSVSMSQLDALITRNGQLSHEHHKQLEMQISEYRYLVSEKQLEINKYLKIISSLKLKLELQTNDSSKDRDSNGSQIVKYQRKIILGSNRYIDDATDSPTLIQQQSINADNDQQQQPKIVSLSILEQDKQQGQQQQFGNSQQNDKTIQYETFDMHQHNQNHKSTMTQMHTMEKTNQSIQTITQHTQMHEIQIQTVHLQIKLCDIGVQVHQQETNTQYIQTVDSQCHDQQTQTMPSIIIPTQQYSVQASPIQQMNHEQEVYNEKLAQLLRQHRGQIQYYCMKIAQLQGTIVQLDNKNQSRIKMMRESMLRLVLQIKQLSSWTRQRLDQIVAEQLQITRSVLLSSLQQLLQRISIESDNMQQLKIQLLTVQHMIENNSIKQHKDCGINTQTNESIQKQSQTQYFEAVDATIAITNKNQQALLLSQVKSVNFQQRQAIENNNNIAENTNMDDSGLVSLFQSHKFQYSCQQNDIYALKCELKYQRQLNKKIQAQAIQKLIDSGYLTKTKLFNDNSFTRFHGLQQLVMFIDASGTIEQQQQQQSRNSSKIADNIDNKPASSDCDKQDNIYWSPNKPCLTQTLNIQYLPNAMTDPKLRHQSKASTNKQNQLENDIEIQKIFDF